MRGRIPYLSTHDRCPQAAAGNERLVARSRSRFERALRPEVLTVPQAVEDDLHPVSRISRACRSA